MKRSIYLLGLLAISTWAATPPKPTTEYQLKNGLTVFLTENPKAPNVTVSHWVKAGSLHEKPGTTGIAHLFEHMMFRPLKKGAVSYNDLASQMGAVNNASTRFESTYYYASIAKERLGDLLKIESDRFKKLVITDELLDIERAAVWSEYSTKFDANPMIDLWFQAYIQGYKNHPFGWMIIGFREDLEKIKAADCNAFFKKYYNPSNVGLFITGDFKSADAVKLIDKYYADWKPGEASVLPPWSDAGGTVKGEGKLTSNAKTIIFGFRTPYLAKDNIEVQSMAEYILFGSNMSLISKRLVDAKKIASYASGFNFEYDNGMIKALISPLAKVKFAKVESEVKKIKDDFKNLSDADFNMYKKNFYIRASEALLSNAGLEEQLALAWGKYGDLDFAERIKQGPLPVTKVQVQAFLDKYFTNDNLVFITPKGQLK